MDKKKITWLNTKPNSAKTLIERAKQEVPHFKAHYAKFEEQRRLEVTLKVLCLTIQERLQK